MTQTAFTHEPLDDTLTSLAYNGDLEALKKVYNQSTNINISNDAVLYSAARGGHLDVIRYLIEEHNINVHAQNDQALIHAATNGHIAMVRYLVEEHNTNIHAQHGGALGGAAQNGHFNIVRYFIEERNASIHLGNDSALRYSLTRGHIEVTHYLVEKGADYKKVRDEHFFPAFWPEDKIKALFTLNFVLNQTGAAMHFWSLLQNRRKTYTLRKHFETNSFLAMQSLKKKPRRIAQPQPKKTGTAPS